MRQQNNHHQSRLRKQDTCQWLVGQVVIKTNRSDKTEIKKIFKISGHQQRWPRPLPGAILIPPALLVVADFPEMQPKSEWVKSLMLQAWDAGCKVYCKPNLKAGVKEYPL